MTSNEEKCSYSADTVLLIGCIAAVFVLRAVGAGSAELSPQEAYYWNYAMHPALSYYDHPPVIAWTIALGTLVFGHTEFGVRAGGLLFSLGSTALVYSLGKLWFGKKAGLWSALLFQLVPLYFLYGMVMTPDVPLMFFWLATMHATSTTLQHDNRYGWYLAGACLGFSMLSKYTGAFLIPSTLFFLLMDRSYRAWLWRKEPYLALLVAAAIFSPVIIWNHQHGWPSFHFQFTERFQAAGINPILGLLQFVGIQAAALFPVFFAGCVAVLVTSIFSMVKKPRSKWALCIAYSLPLLLFFTYYSAYHSVKPHWLIPGYLSLIVALYPFYRLARFKAASGLRVAGQRAVMASLYGLPLLFVLGVYHNSVGIPYFPVNKWVAGWEDLGRVIETERRQFQSESGRPVFLIGMDKHYLPSQLAFYTRDYKTTYSPDLVGKRGLAYEYWGKADLQGQHALVVHEQVPNIGRLKRYFAHVDSRMQTIRATWQGNVVRTFYAVRCYDYLGLGKPDTTAALSMDARQAGLFR